MRNLQPQAPQGNDWRETSFVKLVQAVDGQHCRDVMTLPEALVTLQVANISCRVITVKGIRGRPFYEGLVYLCRFLRRRPHPEFC